MCASMNRTGKSNAKKGPDIDYNAFKDFFERETEAHIICKWMEFAGMDSIEGRLFILFYLIFLHSFNFYCKYKCLATPLYSTSLL